MADHLIRIGASPAGRIVVWCSCAARTPILQVDPGAILSLDGLSVLAHEHIESSDRGTETDAVTAGHGGYRAESSVRSADELVDLEHP